MNLLSPTEREALLRSLSDAPDEILIDVVRQRKDWMKNVRSSFDEVRGFVGMKVSEPVKPPPVSAGSIPVVKSAPQEVAPRPNVDPGKSSITRISAGVKDGILADIRNGSKGIGTFLNGRYEEHLKLLHNRGEIKYDGKDYYL